MEFLVQLLYKVVVHLSLADFNMNEYIIRFVTRIIGCFAMLGSLWLLSKIETLKKPLENLDKTKLPSIDEFEKKACFETYIF